jgi:hypothetical protein
MALATSFLAESLTRWARSQASSSATSDRLRSLRMRCHGFYAFPVKVGFSLSVRSRAARAAASLRCI